MSVPECGAGGLLEGGMSMNSTPGNGFSRAIVWLFSGVRVLAWFVLCGVCGLVRSAGPLVGVGGVGRAHGSCDAIDNVWCTVGF